MKTKYSSWSLDASVLLFFIALLTWHVGISSVADSIQLTECLLMQVIPISILLGIKGPKNSHTPLSQFVKVVVIGQTIFGVTRMGFWFLCAYLLSRHTASNNIVSPTSEVMQRMNQEQEMSIHYGVSYLLIALVVFSAWWRTDRLIQFRPRQQNRPRP